MGALSVSSGKEMPITTKDVGSSMLTCVGILVWI